MDKTNKAGCIIGIPLGVVFTLFILFYTMNLKEVWMRPAAEVSFLNWTSCCLPSKQKGVLALKHGSGLSAICQNTTIPTGWRTENVKIIKDLVYYNRVPKCGSSTLLSLIDILSKHNNFLHAHETVYNLRTLSQENQKKHAKNVLGYPNYPVFYDRHLRFFDFGSFNKPQPVWINMVRDPVKKYISYFYFDRTNIQQPFAKKAYNARRKAMGQQAFEEWLYSSLDECFAQEANNCNLELTVGKKADWASIPFFCGQEKECSLLGSDWALKKAKENIEKWYAVVGLLEEFNTTLTVLEHAMPRFFKDAPKLYNTYLKVAYEKHETAPDISEDRTKNVRLKRLTFNRNENAGLSEENTVKLRSKLSKEYELYNFVKQRLHRQLASINCNTYFADPV